MPPLLWVTITSTAPAAWAGVVALTVDASSTTTFVAGAPPIVTVAPAANLWPVIVTAVPPNVVPVEGLMDLTAGPVGVGVGAAGESLQPDAARTLRALRPSRGRSVRRVRRAVTNFIAALYGRAGRRCLPHLPNCAHRLVLRLVIDPCLRGSSDPPPPRGRCPSSSAIPP